MLKSSTSGKKLQHFQASPSAEPRSPRRRQDPWQTPNIDSNLENDNDANNSEYQSDSSSKSRNCPSARRKKVSIESNTTVNNQSKSKTFAIKNNQPTNGNDYKRVTGSRIPQPKRKSTSMKVSEEQPSEQDNPQNNDEIKNRAP